MKSRETHLFRVVFSTEEDPDDAMTAIVRACCAEHAGLVAMYTTRPDITEGTLIAKISDLDPAPPERFFFRLLAAREAAEMDHILAGGGSA